MRIYERVAAIIGMVAITAALAGSASAGRIGEGTLEFRGAGDFDHERLKLDGTFVGSTTEASVSLGLAIGVTELVMVGGSVFFDYVSIDPEAGSSASASAFRLDGDVILNFPTEGNLVPFAQASVGMINWSATGESDLDVTLVLPFVGGGFRVLMGDHASINVAAGYELHTNAVGDGDATSNNFVVRFGLSAFPKGLE